MRKLRRKWSKARPPFKYALFFALGIAATCGGAWVWYWHIDSSLILVRAEYLMRLFAMIQACRSM